jgi:hypothetical protein
MTTESKLQKVLDEFKLSMAEYVMLHQIHYDPRDASVAPEFAIALLSHTDLNLPTEQQCRDAINSLCNRNIITIVDSMTRKKISHYLKTKSGIGPTDGLPLLGETDLTLKGADVWRDVLNEKNAERPIDYYWHNTGDFIYRRNGIIAVSSNIEQLNKDLVRCDLTPIGPCEPIGVWRRQWWREIPRGYVQRCLPRR